MKKSRIAFVAIRYGQDINGGVECHCRMLAERLVNDYEVEVLTTCVRDGNTGENELPEGVERYNGVLVRRFKVEPVERDKHELHLKEEKLARKIRRRLFRWKMLKIVASLHPVWHYKREEELRAFQSYLYYSPDMRHYIQENKYSYAAFIPMNMAEPTTYYTSVDAGEKTILIPTMHNQNVFFKALQTEVMTKVAYIGFNTEAEQKLAEDVFGKHMSEHGIISVGTESPVPASWIETKEKYGLSGNYLLYMGRIESNKVGDIYDYFMSYKKRYLDSTLKLVLVGGIGSTKVRYSHPDISYTGFISEEEKMIILQHSFAVINPSKYESLSLMLLEAMSQGKPTLVNGDCEVLKEHCVKSDNAALYYTSKRTFMMHLRQLEVSEDLRSTMAEKAMRYVEENYNWKVILRRLKTAIEKVSSKN